MTANPAPPFACEWKLEDSEYGTWTPSCDPNQVWYLEADDPKANGMKFCPFCGRPLAQSPLTHHRETQDASE